MKALLVSILLTFTTLYASADVVSRPEVQRLVNDFANLLDAEQVQALEDSLVSYSNRTSTQVLVVTIGDLEGYPVADYAYQIGQKWGVGQKGKNNGVVILVKPKLSENDRGQAFIAPGYGLEGVLPDITCTHIVRDEMIPYFREDNYAGGIIAAAIAVMQACEGEYNASPASGDGDGSAGLVFLVIIIILIVFIATRKGNKGGRGSSMGPLVSGAATSWQTFNHSSSTFSPHSSGGFGGGGFGGFGGGSFGGGGGGGSW